MYTFIKLYEEGSALFQSTYMAAPAARRLAPPVGGLFATSAKRLPVRQKKRFMNL